MLGDCLCDKCGEPVPAVQESGMFARVEIIVKGIHKLNWRILICKNCDWKDELKTVIPS